MNRTEKEAFVADFRSRVEKAPVFYLADFTGLDVKAMTVLRAQLKYTLVVLATVPLAAWLIFVVPGW